jgi:hypothetical protein
MTVGIDIEPGHTRLTAFAAPAGAIGAIGVP